jgi:hypothetical protein
MLLLLLLLLALLDQQTQFVVAVPEDGWYYALL